MHYRLIYIPTVQRGRLLKNALHQYAKYGSNKRLQITDTGKSLYLPFGTSCPSSQIATNLHSLTLAMPHIVSGFGVSTHLAGPPCLVSQNFRHLVWPHRLGPQNFTISNTGKIVRSRHAERNLRTPTASAADTLILLRHPPRSHAEVTDAAVAADVWTLPCSLTMFLASIPPRKKRSCCLG